MVEATIPSKSVVPPMKLRPLSASRFRQISESQAEAINVNRPQSARGVPRRLPPLRGVRVEYDVTQRAVLTNSGELRTIWHARTVLKEVEAPPPVDPLKLYLLHRIYNDQERPIMPCLDESFLDLNIDNKFGYRRIIRDRNKDWRELLWTDMVPNLKPANRHRQSSGVEETLEDADMLPQPTKVFTDGVLLNKTLLLLREAHTIGGTNIILSIYGMGIAGRVYFETINAPRFLLFEAFLPSVLASCSLRVDTKDLKSILGDDAWLLRSLD